MNSGRFLVLFLLQRSGRELLTTTRTGIKGIVFRQLAK